MSARTASSASRLPWISLIIALNNGQLPLCLTGNTSSKDYPGRSLFTEHDRPKFSSEIKLWRVRSVKTDMHAFTQWNTATVPRKKNSDNIQRDTESDRVWQKITTALRDRPKSFHQSPNSSSTGAPSQGSVYSYHSLPVSKSSDFISTECLQKTTLLHSWLKNTPKLSQIATFGDDFSPQIESKHRKPG